MVTRMCVSNYNPMSEHDYAAQTVYGDGRKSTSKKYIVLVAQMGSSSPDRTVSMVQGDRGMLTSTFVIKFTTQFYSYVL